MRAAPDESIRRVAAIRPMCVVRGRIKTKTGIRQDIPIHYFRSSESGKCL